MAGKFLCQIVLSLFIFVGILNLSDGSPFYSSSSLLDAQGGGTRLGGRPMVADVDKPIDSILEAVMEIGGNVLFLVPQRDFEKRDPPDLGTGRSYSGQRTAKVMWGQLASNSPSGPGRRKRNFAVRKLNLFPLPGRTASQDPEEM